MPDGLQHLLIGATARRIALGLTQRDVARMLGTSQSAISDLERGAAMPRITTLLRYLRALGLGLDLIELRPEVPDA